jgi:biopolymer transport protein ExbD
MRFSTPDEENDEINLTPLIDVVFLLLIFFMLTTTFKQEAALTIDLPEANAIQQQEVSLNIEVLIDKQGRYALNGEPLQRYSPTQLRRNLEQLRTENGDLKLVIRADGASSHQSVVRVLDAAAAVGLLHIAIAANSEPLEDLK